MCLIEMKIKRIENGEEKYKIFWVGKAFGWVIFWGGVEMAKKRVWGGFPIPRPHSTSASRQFFSPTPF